MLKQCFSIFSHSSVISFVCALVSSISISKTWHELLTRSQESCSRKLCHAGAKAQIQKLEARVKDLAAWRQFFWGGVSRLQSTTESQALLQLSKSQTVRRSLVVRLCLLPARRVSMRHTRVKDGLLMPQTYHTLLMISCHQMHRLTTPLDNRGDMKRDPGPGS